MNNILNGLFVILECYLVLCVALIIIGIDEHMEKKRKEKAKRKKAYRKAQYEQECLHAGREMMNKDNVCKVLAENGKRNKQTIKYTGYYSGEKVEKELAKYKAERCV